MLKGNRYVKKNQLLTFGLLGENFKGIDIWGFFLDKAMRLFVSSKTSNSCELIWWVDIQDRDMISTYTAHCKPLEPRKKRFKPVPLKLGPECRQVHEIVKLESNTNYSVSIYKQSRIYTQQVKVKTLPKGKSLSLHHYINRANRVVVHTLLE